MASVYAKIGCKMPWKREYKKYCSVLFLHVIENSNKIAKKFKKLKNIIMASF